MVPASTVILCVGRLFWRAPLRGAPAGHRPDRRDNGLPRLCHARRLSQSANARDPLSPLRRRSHRQVHAVPGASEALRFRGIPRERMV